MSNEKDVSKELTDAVNKVLSRREAVKKAGSIATGTALAFLGLNLPGISRQKLAIGDCVSGCNAICSDNCTGGCLFGCNTTCTGGCKGTCNTTCTGCTGTCVGGCTSCTGCTGGCSGGCTGCTGSGGCGC